MPDDSGDETRFIADRMLGTLTRYLRFMGYDTTSANRLAEGNTKEDTLLLDMASQENRILLTRDAELARRGKERAVFVRPGNVMDQVQQLIDAGLIERRLTLSRCSLCNTLLRDASHGEISGADYAPRDRDGFSFFWCEHCKKLYWNGSHGRQLEERLGKILK
ncbi:Mut7-C RNAse domain-containing protein [Methanoregula sp.]|uniref:Mut7-C RNAse domain-containing protein n=1 Tax=Methanoregula sp. TaxID=2052170 RepID=UPI00237026BF|nr:Mut7-C RNAse domain-containing protein [Methanoregula sp.]MDD1687617.1 Mut7-C RNAse domain-containing protein [Methanoregula sp.]